MAGGQPGVSRLLVAIGAVVAVLLLGFGGAAGIKVSPFAPPGAVVNVGPSASPGSVSTAAPTGHSGGGQPATANRPRDARQAVVDAVRRTADFKDVTYVRTFTFSSATVKTINSSSQVSATKSPVMIDTKSTSGKRFESILNGANHVLCIISEGSPDQRLPGQPIAADAADPFNGLVKNGTKWEFLDDVDLGGHRAWHVIGDIIQTQTTGGPSPKSNPGNINTAEVWIDSRSGKIEKRLDHAAGSEGATKYDRTTTDTNFVYNSGVTIPPCQ